VKFEIIKSDSFTDARVASLTTSHGTVKTPVFMPVATRGTIRALTMRDIEEIGFEIILSNSYHLYIRPGMDVIAAAGGLHRFMNFNKPILTDSGGFQVFSLSDLCNVYDAGVEFKSHLDGSTHFFSPEKVLDIQRIIGSDIMMVLDQCIPYPSHRENAEAAVRRTVEWARSSLGYWHGGFDTESQSLFAIVQGSVFRDLRRECAAILVEMDFPGFAIGGLSVGEPNELYMEMTEVSLKQLPKNRPKYMMGVGSPMEILFAISCGVDMFDCVMPTRIARNGTLYTSGGRVNIKSSQHASDYSPLDEKCECYVCRNHSRAYLRHLYKMGEISSLIYNSYHNLFFMKSFMSEIQSGILKGRFLEVYKKWESIYGNKGLEEDAGQT
jgi:queuine tRNA-ribosyltransferase